MMTKSSKIDYSKTGYFSSLVLDYLNGDEWLKQFYSLKPSFESVNDSIEGKKKQTINRTELVQSLLNQYGKLLDRNSETYQNVLAINDENTFTVTTAHQPNLFLGPLYLVYKISSAINLAEMLNEKFPQKKFVPVYWMGSEDHDTEELNHIFLYGKKIEWNPSSKGSFGNQKTDSLHGMIKEIELIAGNSEYAKDLIRLLNDCYMESATIKEATRKFVHHFFGQKGLIILDGDDRDLKKIFNPILKDELLKSNSDKWVSLTSSVLKEKYEPQIAPREINLFYLTGTLRERIVKEGNRYKVLNTDLIFSEEEILEELNNYPERFSPNVVLRPLYQEMILPNIFFIGGGAEVSYFLLMKKMFDYFQIHFPIILLRDSALIIDKNSSEKISKLGLKTEELFFETEKLIKKWTLNHSDNFQLEKEKSELKKVFDELNKTVVSKDKSLEQQVNAEWARSLKFIQSLEDRLLKSEKRKHEDSINQIRKVKEKLFPGNSLQERRVSFIEFYLSEGKKIFDLIHDSFNPLEQKFTILNLGN